MCRYVWNPRPDVGGNDCAGANVDYSLCTSSECAGMFETLDLVWVVMTVLGQMWTTHCVHLQHVQVCLNHVWSTVNDYRYDCAETIFVYIYGVCRYVWIMFGPRSMIIVMTVLRQSLCTSTACAGMFERTCFRNPWVPPTSLLITGWNILVMHVHVQGSPQDSY